MAIKKTAFGLLSAAISLLTAGAAHADAPSYSITYSPSGAYTSLAASGDVAVARNASKVDLFLQGPGGWAPMASLSLGQVGSDFSDNDVAVSGDILIVGRDRIAKTDILTRSGSDWVFEETLFSPDSTTTTSFGTSVALAGDTAFIGDPSLGKVYIYQRNADPGAWILTQTLSQPGVHGFGYRLSTDGRNLLVSGDGDSVLVFAPGNGNWSLQQTLTSTAFSAPTLSVVDGVSLFNDIGGVPVSVFAEGGDTWALDQGLDNGNSRYAALVTPTRFIASSLATGLITIFDRDDVSWSNTGSLAPPTCTNDTCSFGKTMQVGAAYFVAAAPDVAGSQGYAPFLYFYHDDNALDSSTILEADNANPAFGTATTLTALVFGDNLSGSVIFRAPFGHLPGCDSVPVVDQGGGLSTATCTIAFPQGSNQVTAQYLGDGVYPTSMSDSVCVSVGPSDRLFADNFEGGACSP